MKLKRIVVIFILLMSICMYVFGTESFITRISGDTVKTLDEYKDELEKVIIENGNKYELKAVNFKEVTKTKEVIEEKVELFEQNDEEEMKNFFGEYLEYNKDNYSGILKLEELKVNEMYNGEHEEIIKKDVDFENYSDNELNIIPKNITENGVEFILINVDWIPENIEIIDGEKVPVTYKGVMHYQGITLVQNPYTYEATVVYKGNVKEKDSKYKYEAIYELKVNKSILPQTLIISGLGIVIIMFILVFKGNCVIYNKTDRGLEKIKRYKLKKSTKEIDLSNQAHKISSNVFSIKVSKSYLRKNLNQSIKIKKKNREKTIYLSNIYNEFLLK